MSQLENTCRREVCLYAIWAHVDLTSSGLALWSHSSESAISTEPCSRLFQTSKVPEDPIHVHRDFREVSLNRAGESRGPKLDGGTPHRPCSTEGHRGHWWPVGKASCGSVTRTGAPHLAMWLSTNHVDLICLSQSHIWEQLLFKSIIPQRTDGRQSFGSR